MFPLMLTVYVVSGLAGLRRVTFKARGIALILLSAVTALYPVAGLSLSDYILSLNPVFSIGSIAFLFLVLWKRFAGAPLLSQRDIVWFSVWNVGLCVCLYASYLGFTGIDVYPLGYGFSPLFVLTAVLTAVLFLFGSPLSYIFISYIIAFDLKVLYSENFFDYMADGVLFFISIGVLISRTIKAMASKSVGSRACACNSGVSE